MKPTSERRSGIGRGVSISVAVVVVILIAAGAAYYFFVAGAAGTSSTSSMTMPTSTTTTATIATSTTTTTTTTTSAQPKTVQVSMPKGVGASQSLNFQPANITLVIGVNNTVMWTNNDGAPHTVTATSVPSGAVKFDSENMNSGATFPYTFTVPGTYTYKCAYHFWMQGTIVVKQAA